MDTLILTGCTTSGCLRATAVDAYAYNFKVVIPEECAFDRFQASHADQSLRPELQVCGCHSGLRRRRLPAGIARPRRLARRVVNGDGARVEAIPVHLLTGFLGSGKSTLLSRLVRQPGFADTAVVINELGEVGIDNVLVDRGSEDGVVLLDSGCLCCALGNSLQETLESLYFRRLRGELPPFARLVVETTGVANPGPIAATLDLDRAIARHYRLAAIVTTVDAIHGGEQMDRFDEALRQVALADRLIVTKTDIANAADVGALRARLAAINPHAAQIVAVDGAVPAGEVLAETALSMRARAAADAADACAAGDAHAVARHDHVADRGIASVAIGLDAPLPWSRYADWSAWLQRAFGEKLLRMKGLVQMDDNVAYALHGVMRLFSAPRPLRALPTGMGAGVIVVIAQDAAPRCSPRRNGGLQNEGIFWIAAQLRLGRRSCRLDPAGAAGCGAGCRCVSSASGEDRRTVRGRWRHRHHGTADGRKTHHTVGQAGRRRDRPGAGSNIGADVVAKSPPDGYTILLGVTGSNAINPSLFRKMHYDAQTDFEPLTLTTVFPNAIVVNRNVPANSLRELIALLKQIPTSTATAQIATAPRRT